MVCSATSANVGLAWQWSIWLQYMFNCSRVIFRRPFKNIQYVKVYPEKVFTVGLVMQWDIWFLHKPHWKWFLWSYYSSRSSHIAVEAIAAEAHIKKQVKHRDKLLRKLKKSHSENTEELHKKFRNRVVSENRKSKINYFDTYFQANKSNMKNLWTDIKSIINTK